MATKTDSLDTIWRTPDALWKLIAPILRHRRAGRPPTGLSFDAMCYDALSMASYSNLLLDPPSTGRQWMFEAWSALLHQIRKWVLRGNGKPLMG